jgi:hypothetical protein
VSQKPEYKILTEASTSDLAKAVNEEFAGAANVHLLGGPFHNPHDNTKLSQALVVLPKQEFTFEAVDLGDPAEKTGEQSPDAGDSQGAEQDAGAGLPAESKKETVPASDGDKPPSDNAISPDTAG